MLVFAAWVAWAMLVAALPISGFRFSPNQLFWLAALPGLGGATLRLILGFASTPFGGRGWHALAAAALGLPALGLVVAVQDPATPYERFVVLALLAGLGGGAFARPSPTPGTGFGEQAQVLRCRHTWRMAWLGLGSFGSLVGFAVGVPLLGGHAFPGAEALGPLPGLLAWPLGTRLADRHGAARVSFWAFVALLGATLAALQGPAGFAALSACAGLATGSTRRMTPALFEALRRRAAAPTPTAQAQAGEAAQHEAHAALGFSGTVGAYGGFLIPKALGTSLSLTGGAQAALWACFAFTLSCIAVTWWHYSRRGAPMPC